MNRKLTWFVSSLGFASVVLSIVLMFPTSASAACYAESTCPKAKKAPFGVSCNGASSCSANDNGVTCDGVTTSCGGGGEEENN